MGFGHPGHQTSSGKMSPFLLVIPEITPSFMKKQKCDCTCAWEGGEKGKGTELQAKKYLILQLLYCFHSTWFFGLAIKSEGFTLSEDLALNFSSELSLLAACQNKYVLGIWQGKEPRLQVHGIFFLFVCDLFVSFLKLLLERFSGIYLLQASGQGLQEKLCSAGFGVREACCLIWVPLLCVRDLLFVCCQDASGH